jgi:hypothetical protein
VLTRKGRTKILILFFSLLNNLFASGMARGDLNLGYIFIEYSSGYSRLRLKILSPSLPVHQPDQVLDWTKNIKTSTTTSVPDPDPPDPHVFGPSGSIMPEVWIRILLSASRNSKKNLDSFFWTFEK